MKMEEVESWKSEADLMAIEYALVCLQMCAKKSETCSPVNCFRVDFCGRGELAVERIKDYISAAR